jgi:hypothetical protein
VAVDNAVFSSEFEHSGKLLATLLGEEETWLKVTH